MMGFWDAVASAGPLCKQSALRFRQITTPTPHHSIFTDRMLFQQCQSTEGKQANNLQNSQVKMQTIVQQLRTDDSAQKTD